MSLYADFPITASANILTFLEISPRNCKQKAGLIQDTFSHFSMVLLQQNADKMKFAKAITIRPGKVIDCVNQ